MKIFLDKFFFGNGKNLILEDGLLNWSNEFDVLCDLYLENSGSKSLNKYLDLFDYKPVGLIKQSQSNIVKTLKIKNPVWKLLLKEEEYKENREKLKKSVDLINNEIFEKKYSKIFSEGNFILNSLGKINVDTEALKKAVQLEENPTLRSIISSFIPKSGKECQLVRYDRLKTTTGRLVVNSGPQILLLPKNKKKMLVSKYGNNGSVLWVDFVSLEPRFTKLLTEEKTELDLYEDILKNSNFNCPRKVIKLAVLSSLFGAGINKLTEILGQDAFAARDLIKDYFSLNQVMKMVGEYKSGKIENYFGRPIKLKKSSSNIALNNYIQSSCVDVALLGFSEIIKDPKFPKSAVPLAIVHDAMAIDVKNSDIQSLEEIINRGIFIEGLGKFYLGYEKHDK